MPSGSHQQQPDYDIVSTGIRAQKTGKPYSHKRRIKRDDKLASHNNSSFIISYVHWKQQFQNTSSISPDLN